VRRCSSLSILALLAGACAGEDAGVYAGELTGPVVPTESWAAAPASCEGIDLAVAARPTEAPELGALLDVRGRVLCVDVVERIVEEYPHLVLRDVIAVRELRAADPEPDPLRRSADPEPDPMTRSADPEPDPMIRNADPEPDPMIRNADPEPDPMRPWPHASRGADLRSTTQDPTPHPIRPRRSF
jgi:hypothetical protein